MIRRLLPFLLLFSLLIPTTLSAQETTHPLVAMMALVPASATQADDAGFMHMSLIDYAALDAARPDVPTYTSWDEFAADSDSEAFGIWQGKRARTAAGNQRLANPIDIFSIGPEMQRVLGFSLFDIQASLEVGLPPVNGTYLWGNFDAESIIAAHTARDYSVNNLAGNAMLCGSVGCDGGDVVDRSPMERDPVTFRPIDENSINHETNLFGGRLRQQHPLVLLPNMIVSSRSLPFLETVFAEETPSALDLPHYLAAVEALTQSNGQLVQVYFLNPTEIATLTFSVTQDYGSIAQYELAMFADWQDGSDQVNGVGLVYTNEADAQAAAAELSQRLATQTVAYDATEILVDYVQGTLEEPQVFFSETAQRWVAMATVRYPVLDNAGTLFQIWYNNYRNGEFFPLCVEC